MKFTADRPYADPEKAARKLVEIANTVDQLAFFKGRRQPRRICRRVAGGDRSRMAGDPSIRHLREVHPSRCGAVRLIGTNRPPPA
jgi:hypothetical protein